MTKKLGYSKIDKVNCPHVFVLKKDVFRCEVCNMTIGQWLMAENKKTKKP